MILKTMVLCCSIVLSAQRICDVTKAEASIWWTVVKLKIPDVWVKTHSCAIVKSEVPLTLLPCGH